MISIGSGDVPPVDMHTSQAQAKRKKSTGEKQMLSGKDRHNACHCRPLPELVTYICQDWQRIATRTGEAFVWPQALVLRVSNTHGQHLIGRRPIKRAKSHGVEFLCILPQGWAPVKVPNRDENVLACMHWVSSNDIVLQGSSDEHRWLWVQSHGLIDDSHRVFQLLYLLNCWLAVP
jgi:hypothetical protein